MLTNEMRKELQVIRNNMIINLNKVASIVESDSYELQNAYIDFQVNLIKAYNELVQNIERDTVDCVKLYITTAEANGRDIVNKFFNLYNIEEHIARMTITVLEFTVINFKRVVLK